MSPRSSVNSSSGSPTRGTAVNASRSAPAATGERRSMAVSPRRTSRRSPRPSASIAGRTASTVRSTSARTRTRCPLQPSTTALEVLAANGVQTIVQQHDGFTPTPVISRAILAWNQRNGRSAGRWNRRHAVPQPAGGWRVQVQPSARRSCRYRRDPLDPGPGERAAAGKECRGQEDRRAWHERARHPCRRISSQPYVDDLHNVIDIEAIRDSGVTIGVDPLGGASLAVLGGDRRALPAEPHHRESEGSTPRSAS